MMQLSSHDENDKSAGMIPVAAVPAFETCSVSSRASQSIALLAALARDGEQMSLSELAHKTGLSLRRTETLMTALRVGHVVTSIRGRTGGYRLAQPPAQLTLLAIVDAAEQDAAENIAPSPWREQASPLTTQIADDFARVVRSLLATRTLADVVARH
jgi:Rrf2 family protein